MTTADQSLDTTVYLPLLGENVEEGSITRWLKQAGEHVEHNEPLLEIATEKVEHRLESGFTSADLAE